MEDEAGGSWEMEEEGLLVWRERLESINQELQSMDATEDFCREFLQTAGGCCERLVGKRCVKHRGCRGPLPRGKMCTIEFGQRVLELRKQAAEVEHDRLRLRREWDRLKVQQRSPDAWSQDLTDQRIEDVKNELLHKQKERLDIMGERLQLLSHDPVDVGAFHQTLTSLLSEKIGVLEMLKLRLPPT